MNNGLDAAISLLAIGFLVASIVTLRAIFSAKEGFETDHGFTCATGSKR
jgi:hypothetical protein